MVELFRIHQRHWDEIRRREMPSFELLGEIVHEARILLFGRLDIVRLRFYRGDCSKSVDGVIEGWQRWFDSIRFGSWQASRAR